MKPYRIPSRWHALLATAALVPASLLAQGAPATSTPPGSRPPAGTNSQDETVQLSTFTVTAEDDQGYYSPQALSGTRTKTELLNLPMNLNVLTEQFIKDIAASDLMDIVTFTGGLISAPATSGDTAGGDTTGFTIRGFGTHVPYRNGFRRLRVVDAMNISRVE